MAVAKGYLQAKYKSNQFAASIRSDISNARLNVIRDAVDAGSGAGTLKLYTGPRPAVGAAITTQTLLGTLTFNDPSAADAAAGILEFSAITADSSADATGVAVWARVADSDDTFVADLGVGAIGSGYDIEMLDTSITAGEAINIASALIYASE
jgi:hypothetical protein